MGERSTGEGRRQRNFCRQNDFTSVAPHTLECWQNAAGYHESLTPGGTCRQGRPGLASQRLEDQPDHLEVDALDRCLMFAGCDLLVDSKDCDSAAITKLSLAVLKPGGKLLARVGRYCRHVHVETSSSSSSSCNICNVPYVAVKMLFVGAGKQLRQHKRN